MRELGKRGDMESILKVVIALIIAAVLFYLVIRGIMGGMSSFSG